MNFDESLSLWDACRISDYVGMVGVILVLLCYFLIQFGLLSHKSFTYSFLNLMGSIFLLLSLMYHWNLASVAIEIAWLLISFYGVIRFFYLKKMTK